MPDGSEWPRVSIVTPNYNYAHYLETTIRSVLLQGYPKLEFVVIDGGSNDGSIDIITKYTKYLDYWVSEKDRGQASAINKGLDHTTGEIIGYINSDDYYLPGAFAAAAWHFHHHPEADLIYGRCRIVNERGEKIGDQFGRLSRLDEVLDLWSVWWAKRQIVQPESFWRRRIYEKVGDFREDLYIVFDYEYWCRMLMAGATFQALDKEVACFRMQPVQKTSNAQRVAAEEMDVIRPLLWDKEVSLDMPRRFRLQGQWLYSNLFLPLIAESAGSGESKARRWLRIFALCLRHPKLLASSSFWHRLSAISSLRESTTAG